MKVVMINDNDFVNYKKACMYIAFPHCTFKCGKELCQNSLLATSPRIEISIENIVKRYIENEYVDSIVMAGLEPFDDFDDLLELVKEFRKHTIDDIIIYTGYYKNEIEDKVELLKKYGKTNLIIKFGRFIPNQEPHLDLVLGVKLASNNQFAEIIC